MSGEDAAGGPSLPEVRVWVAKLYCSAGCSCCRDDETWKQASERLGELLNAPRYGDDSDFDWYTARDAAPERERTGLAPAIGDEFATERERIRQEVINTPETADFMAGVPLEAAHQRERWAADHDAGKTPFDWFWLLGYLGQKAAAAAVAGDPEKAKHHTISAAAALANWHAALAGTDTRMRPGIAEPAEGGDHG